jgi:hypothetical protein
LRFQASPGKQFARPYLKKNPSQKKKRKRKKNWAGGVAQGEGPEFKPLYQKKKKKEKNLITFALAVCFPWTLLSWVGIG